MDWFIVPVAVAALVHGALLGVFIGRGERWRFALALYLPVATGLALWVIAWLTPPHSPMSAGLGGEAAPARRALVTGWNSLVAGLR